MYSRIEAYLDWVAGARYYLDSPMGILPKDNNIFYAFIPKLEDNKCYLILQDLKKAERYKEIGIKEYDIHCPRVDFDFNNLRFESKFVKFRLCDSYYDSPHGVEKCSPTTEWHYKSADNSSQRASIKQTEEKTSPAGSYTIESSFVRDRGAGGQYDYTLVNNFTGEKITISKLLMNDDDFRILYSDSYKPFPVFHFKWAGENPVFDVADGWEILNGMWEYEVTEMRFIYRDDKWTPGS